MNELNYQKKYSRLKRVINNYASTLEKIYMLDANIIKLSKKQIIKNISMDLLEYLEEEDNE